MRFAVVKLLCVLCLNAAATAYAAPDPAPMAARPNPLYKPPALTNAAAMPTPFYGPPSLIPSPAVGSVPTLENRPGQPVVKEKDEALSVVGLYVSTILNDRAVLRQPITPPPGAAAGAQAPTLAPMTAATGTSSGQSAGATAIVRQHVYRVRDGETLELTDGTKLDVKISAGTAVRLVSQSSGRTLFAGTLDAVNGPPVVPSETTLVKPDGKYNRSSFIKPLSAPAAGATGAGAAGATP